MDAKINKSVFSLPVEYEISDLRFCLEQTIEKGKNGAFVDKMGEKIFPWKVINYRRPVLTEKLRSQFVKAQREPDYWLRHRTDLEWIWNEQIDTTLIETMISKLMPFFKKLTRVCSLVQLPGFEIPAHKDRVDGSIYKNTEEELESVFSEKNTFQQDNNNLCLKIPLFRDLDHYGKPFIMIDEEKIFYNFKNKAFVLNEVDVFHGVSPVDFERGVIVMDGILDLEKLEKYCGSV